MHRNVAAIVVGGALLLPAYLLVRTGLYGFAIFVSLPVILGGFASLITDSKTESGAIKAGALAALLSTCLFLLLGLEGAICIVMSLPLAVPLGAAGGLIAFQLRSAGRGFTGAGMMLLLPSSLLWDLNAPNPVFEVRTAIEIAAPVETVWQNVVSFSDLPEPEEWYFRAGIAYPKRARIEGTGSSAVRYCEFSTGPFVEPIEVWDEPRLLRFRVTENPAPMEEWSPYNNVLPRHLHGYLVSQNGQFRLTSLPGNRTLLEGTTWYQHGLQPATYWRLWSDAIIHRIHLRVLNHIRRLSEQSANRLGNR